MNAAQVMVKFMEKTRITLTDNSLIKIGKVMSKKGFEKIKKNGNAYYMVRVLDSEEVDKNNRTFDVEVEVGNDVFDKSLDDIILENTEDEQYRNFEEDLG